MRGPHSETMKTLPPRNGTPRHQEFFYNKPLCVPLCLRAFVAILMAGRLNLT